LGWESAEEVVEEGAEEVVAWALVVRGSLLPSV
jgi:hypothetical protein